MGVDGRALSYRRLDGTATVVMLDEQGRVVGYADDDSLLD